MAEIEFSKRAKDFLKKCERETNERILAKIELLRENQYPQNCRRVHGENGKIFRIRVGDYRILYEVLINQILITKIDKREKVYD